MFAALLTVCQEQRSCDDGERKVKVVETEAASLWLAEVETEERIFLQRNRKRRGIVFLFLKKECSWLPGATDK